VAQVASQLLETGLITVAFVKKVPPPTLTDAGNEEIPDPPDIPDSWAIDCCTVIARVAFKFATRTVANTFDSTYVCRPRLPVNRNARYVLSGELQESTTVDVCELLTPSLDATTAFTLFSSKPSMPDTASQPTLLDDIHSVNDSV
jgi:hypothetical protein